MSDLSDSFLPGLKARSKAGLPGLKARSKDRVEDALQDIDQVGEPQGIRGQGACCSNRHPGTQEAGPQAIAPDTATAPARAPGHWPGLSRSREKT